MIYMKRVLCIVLAIVSLLCLTACTQTGGSEQSGGPAVEAVAPDYSSSEASLPIYGYTPPPADRDGVNYQTLESYKTYKEAGLNILLLQADDGYDGEPWETSHLKEQMDLATEAGIDKIIVFDHRLWRLTGLNTGLVGNKYGTEEELDAYVANCVKDYAAHPSFYGIQLRDEPAYNYFASIGDLYRSLKRVLPDNFIQFNLLPANNSAKSSYCSGGADMELAEAYKAYLTKFLDETDADYIMFDSYPMSGTSIRGAHFTTLQVANEVAKERGVDIYAVAQTCSYSTNGAIQARVCTEADLYWQTNVYMGFGIKQLSYFNYWKKKDSNNEVFFDNASFISNNGEKTEIYGYMQKINGELQELAKVSMNFDYVGCFYSTSQPSDYSVSYLSGLQIGNLTHVTNVTYGSSQAVLITELYDEEKGNTMYMIQNILDPIYVEGEGDCILEAEITFKDCTHLLVIDKGVSSTVELQKGRYSVTLEPGHAVFVIPY